MKITKEEMCLQGIELFKKNGYEKVSVSDICDACGVTRGSFYHHFEDKADMLQYYYHDLIGLYLADFEINPSLKGKEAIQSYVHSFVEVLMSLGKELLYTTIKLLDPKETENQEMNDDFHTMLFETSFNHLKSIVEEAQEEGYVSKENSAGCLVHLFGVFMVGLIIEWHHSSDKYDFESTALSLSEAIFR